MSKLPFIIWHLSLVWGYMQPGLISVSLSYQNHTCSPHIIITHTGYQFHFESSIQYSSCLYTNCNALKALSPVQHIWQPWLITNSWMKLSGYVVRVDEWGDMRLTGHKNIVLDSGIYIPPSCPKCFKPIYTKLKSSSSTTEVVWQICIGFWCMCCQCIHDFKQVNIDNQFRTTTACKIVLDMPSLS